MNLNKEQQNQRQTNHRHAWWRSPLVGYPLAVLFVACAFLIPWSESALGIQNYFVASPFVLAVLLIGWIWGIGPALLAMLLSVLIVDYWFIPPVGSFSFFLWPAIASFVPFILLQLIVLGLVIAQRNYRQELHLANQALSQRAEELAESNARLEHADRVKDQFLSMASHELRTPVTSIQGQVQLLQRRLKRQSAQSPALQAVCDSLGKVEEQTRRLTALVNDLLDINILRSGKMPIQVGPCDLCDLCRSVVEEQRTLTGRQIELELFSCPLMLQADEKRLAQVATNLISNALKYSPESIVIHVKVSQRSTEAILAVHNESPAISKEQQEAIFEPFYRSPDARCSRISGWGMGLAICKEIVARHDGRIWVESSEETGTTFFVALPLSIDKLP